MMGDCTMFIIDKMCLYHSYDKAHDMTSDGIWISSHKAKVGEVQTN